MKDYKKELMNYCDKAMENEFRGEEAKKDESFGAIEFAFWAGLITKEEREELSEKYRLV
ncbi:MAG: hypothetical protein J6B94_08420 [Lachnospiraceae bacterium]|nr:hypothetical protein [Lachnospiraceae bacterium]